MMEPTSTNAHDLAIPLGVSLATGSEVSFSWRAFERGGYFTGQSGQGKSSTICRLLTEVTGRGAPAIIIDDAGETFLQMERFAAFRAAELRAALIEARMPEHVRRQVLRDHVLDRFTFGFLGHGRKNRVGIDIFKRRTVAGRRESVEEVALAALKPFEARFSDMEIRTKFLTVAEPLFICLIAGERPITEALALLLDPQYWPFLLREIERCKTLDEAESRDFVLPHLHEMRELLDVRRNKDGLELRPYSQRYMDLVGSTKHAVRFFRGETVVGKFFEADTFSPEDVVFGNGVFALTSNITSEMSRNLAVRSVYCFFERLMAYREPYMKEQLNRLYLVLDEIRWFHEGLTRFLSVARNHKVSTFILNQQDSQWEQLGMRALASVIPNLLRFRIQYRASTREAADDMAMTEAKYNPFGLQQLVDVYSDTEGEAEGGSDSYTDSDGFSDGDSWGNGGSRKDTGEESSSWNSGGSRVRTSGSSRSSGTNHSSSKSRTRSDQLLNAGVNDQHFLRMQELRSLPEHCAMVSFEETSARLRMYPYEPYATRLDGVDWYDWLHQASTRHHERKRRENPRPPFNPTITIFRGEPAAPPPPAAEPVHPGKRSPDPAPKKKQATGRR
jgi:hypothetical protein